MAYNQDINFTKGDTIRWTQFFRNSDGSTFNFSGSTVYMNVRNSYSSGDSVISYTKYVSQATPAMAGLTGGISTELTGTMYICIGSTYSNKLKAERTATYEIKVTTPQKNTTTLLKGNLYPAQEVSPLQLNNVSNI